MRASKIFIITLLILSLPMICLARTKTPAKDIRTNITNFDGNLSTADDEVQKSLDTLDDMKLQDVTCEITDNWCLKWENNVLKVYVNGTLQAQSPIVEFVSTDALLLESGDYLLLESGDKLLLE